MYNISFDGTSAWKRDGKCTHERQRAECVYVKRAFVQQKSVGFASELSMRSSTSNRAYVCIFVRHFFFSLSSSRLRLYSSAFHTSIFLSFGLDCVLHTEECINTVLAVRARFISAVAFDRCMFSFSYVSFALITIIWPTVWFWNVFCEFFFSRMYVVREKKNLRNERIKHTHKQRTATLSRQIYTHSLCVLDDDDGREKNAAPKTQNWIFKSECVCVCAFLIHLNKFAWLSHVLCYIQLSAIFRRFDSMAQKKQPNEQGMKKDWSVADILDLCIAANSFLWILLTQIRVFFFSFRSLFSLQFILFALV